MGPVFLYKMKLAVHAGLAYPPIKDIWDFTFLNASIQISPSQVSFVPHFPDWNPDLDIRDLLALRIQPSMKLCYSYN